MSSDRPGIGYRVGFPSHEPPIDLSGWKFPLLERALAVHETIIERHGWRSWKTVLDAVRKSETAGEDFDALPQKVKKLIVKAES